MDNLLHFTIPKDLLYARYSSKKLWECLNYLNIKKPMLIIDPGVEKSSYGKEIVASISRMRPTIFSNITTNPSVTQVENAVNLYRQYNPDGVIAIGGGSAIDLAKVCMLTGTNAGSVSEYLAGKQGKRRFPPFITIPTTCGTGSEASPFAVITDRVKKRKIGISDPKFIADLVILDSVFLESLDTSFLASTAIDALTHTLESYISRKAAGITRAPVKGLLYRGRYLINTATAKRSPESLDNLLVNAFTSRLFYPRTGLSIVHALSHPLGATTNLHHGMAVLFFLPDSLIFNYPACRESLSEALSLMGFCSLEEFIVWLDNLADQTGIKKIIGSTLESCVIDSDYLASEAMRSSNIPSNPRDVTQKMLINIVTDSIKRWAPKKGGKPRE